MASISLELLINFPIAIKRTCYKIGGYAYNNKRRNLHNISVYINTIDLSVHTISLNGMIDQKNPANRNSGFFWISQLDSLYSSPWSLQLSELPTDRAKIEIANQMAGIWLMQNSCVRPLFCAFMFEGLATGWYLRTGLLNFQFNTLREVW
jgi:hypothetical protein